MVVGKICLVIKWLSPIGSSELDMRWLRETLTECVQKCWLLRFCKNKKDEKRGKGAKKARKRAAETKRNGKGLETSEKAQTAAK